MNISAALDQYRGICSDVLNRYTAKLNNQGERTGKKGRPKRLDGKIEFGNLDHTRMEKLHMN